MKYTKGMLRAARLHNDHNIMTRGQARAALFYRAYDGRMVVSSSWIVYGNGFDTDPEAPWYNHGRKTFLVMSPVVTNKPLVLQDAKDWAAEHYGIAEWERSPFGGWTPVGTMAKAITSEATS